MDTAAKRASALGRSLPFLTVYPIPDGTVDVGDRAQTLWLYRGLADTPPEPVETPAERTFSVQAQNRAAAVQAQVRSATVRAQPRTFEVT